MKSALEAAGKKHLSNHTTLLTEVSVSPSTGTLQRPLEAPLKIIEFFSFTVLSNEDDTIPRERNF